MCLDVEEHCTFGNCMNPVDRWISKCRAVEEFKACKGFVPTSLKSSDLFCKVCFAAGKHKWTGQDIQRALQSGTF